MTRIALKMLTGDRSKYIAIGSQLAGVVTAVRVHVGQEVKAGDVLFELDKRQTEADLKVQRAAVKAAEAQLHQLELQPRAEMVPHTSRRSGSPRPTSASRRICTSEASACTRLAPSASRTW